MEKLTTFDEWAQRPDVDLAFKKVARRLANSIDRDVFNLVRHYRPPDGWCESFIARRQWPRVYHWRRREYLRDMRWADAYRIRLESGD